jgi:hypothetical protein
MSLSRLVCIALLCAVAAHCAQAAPILTVTPGGLNGGNREWIVKIALDTSLPFDGNSSMATELAFSIDDPVDLLSVVVGDASIWDTPNPGNNPFSDIEMDGIYISQIDDNSFAAYGSAIVTNDVPTHFLTITTAGSGPTTLRYGTAASGHPSQGARIAQAVGFVGQNFDGYTGIVTIVPEPATAITAMFAALVMVGGNCRRRRA